MPDINLITNNSRNKFSDKRVRQLRLASFSLLTLVGILSIVIFLISLRLSVNSIKKKESDITQNLSASNQKAAKIYLQNQRLDDISTLISQRKKYNEVGKSIVDILPSGAILESLDIGADVMTVKIKSSSLLDLNSYLNSLLSIDKKRLSGLVLESLDIDQGQYAMLVKAKVL